FVQAVTRRTLGAKLGSPRRARFPVRSPAVVPRDGARRHRLTLDLPAPGILCALSSGEKRQILLDATYFATELRVRPSLRPFEATALAAGPDLLRDLSLSARR